MLVAFSGCSVDIGSGHFRRIYRARVPAAGLRQIEIKGENGDVYATGANVDTIEVLAKIETSDFAALPHDTVLLARAGGTETISSSCSTARAFIWQLQNCGVDYQIVYPRRLHITVAVTNGDIHIAAAAAPLKASTTNGDIAIRDASSDIAARTHQGDVSASLAPKWAGRGIAIETTFGDATLRTPPDFRAVVHAHTVAGDTPETSSIPVGPAHVTITTTFGDVTIRNDS